jgi:drug/metabolite transporter (DMT)-like permease
MLVPVTGVLSSWLFLGEVPHVDELVAGASVVVGVFYSSRVRLTTQAAMFVSRLIIVSGFGRLGAD